MTPTITFREAYSLPHLITSLYSPILPPFTKSVHKISVCHNELAQARHKFLAKAQIQPTALANFFFLYKTCTSVSYVIPYLGVVPLLEVVATLR